MNPGVRTVILEVLATVAPEIESEKIRTDQNLREQVDLDSMDFLSFMIGLHQRFNVDIPEADYEKLTTLDNIASYLASKN